MVKNLILQIPKCGTQCISVEKCQSLISKILNMKNALNLATGLANTLKKMKGSCAILDKMLDSLSEPKLDSVKNAIDRILADESFPAKGNILSQVQRCFALRAGIDSLLDVARQSYNDVIDDIYNLAQQYRDEYGIGSIKVVYNIRRGYHLSMKSDISSLPPIFIQKSQKGHCTLCTTEDLASLANRHNESVQEIYLMTGRILEVI